MATVTHSFSPKMLARHDTKEDADKMAETAAVTNSAYTYQSRYSERDVCWVVAVLDQHGNLHGYIHPIKE